MCGVAELLVRTSQTSESARLEALSSYSILDTVPEQRFDDITEIAAAVCGVPISLVSFVTGDRQWFKAEKGLGIRETTRDLSFCAHTLTTKQTLVIPDAREDPRFSGNALVTGEPGIRFYAGAPILEKNGHALGTVCVIDKEPRSLSPQQIMALEALARQAVGLLEHQTIAVEKAELANEATRALELAERTNEQLQFAMDSTNLAAWYYEPTQNIFGGDSRMRTLFGVPEAEAALEVWLAAIVEQDRERVGTEFAASLMGRHYDTKYRVQVGDKLHWVHARARMIPIAEDRVRMVGICEDLGQDKALAADR